MCIVSIFEIVLIKPKPAQLRYLPEARILIGQLLVTCLDTVLWLVNILVLALKHRNIVAEWLIMVLMLTIHCSDPLIYSTLVNTALSNLQKKGCGDADIENRNFVKISSIWWFWIFLKWFLTIFFHIFLFSNILLIRFHSATLLTISVRSPGCGVGTTHSKQGLLIF